MIPPFSFCYDLHELYTIVFNLFSSINIFINSIDKDLYLSLYFLCSFNLINLNIRGFFTYTPLFLNPVGRPRKNPIPPLDPSVLSSLVPYGVYNQGFSLGNNSLLNIYKILYYPSSYIMQVLTGLLLSDGSLSSAKNYLSAYSSWTWRS